MLERKNSKVSAKITYALSGKLLCSCCGAPMNGHSTNGIRSSYYICSSKKNKASFCESKCVNKDAIEQAFRTTVTQQLLEQRAEIMKTFNSISLDEIAETKKA